ncbi:MAG: DUF3048 domain-containing protein [Anaerolineae bacterium]|nr:DUF3048 domain-containing protein [Anaerolineae bacterium]
MLVATPFPPDVNPLTGLKVENETLLDRIPIAVKVSNSPEVRPQSGLGSADLVFEHFTEAQVTRLTAVFYTNEPEQVGSVRSGRLIDLEIPAMYKALFGYSGSSAGVKERIRRTDLFPDYIAAPDFGVGQPYFYRVPQGGKAFEHTLFASLPALRELAIERGINQRPDFPMLMAFSEAVPAGGKPMTSLAVDYSAGCLAQWAYSESEGTWARSQSGNPDVDALTGKRITAANVLVVYANHVHADFWEQMIGSSSSWLLSVEIQLWGQGTVLMFRDGQAIPGIWKREARGDMLTFYDGNGAPLPLKPGNSWIQVVPIDTESNEVGEGQLELNPPRM